MSDERPGDVTSYRQVTADVDNQRLQDPNVRRVRVHGYEDQGDRVLMFGRDAAGELVAFHLAAGEQVELMKRLLDSGERVEANLSHSGEDRPGLS